MILDLAAFLRESNDIEGIKTVRPPEMNAAADFIGLDQPTLADVENYVRITQPNAVLRDQIGLDVCVGDYVAPPGGPAIRTALEDLLNGLPTYTPYEAYVLYELLHPFTDGNGRSGRLVWLWLMVRKHGGAPLNFLRHFHYQSLEAVS